MQNSINNEEIKKTIGDAKIPRTKRVKVGAKTINVPTPYPSPDDWRDVWIYFVLLDRFNNPAMPPKERWDGEIGTFQGGTFNGVREKLDYLKELGIGALWLSPVLKNPQHNPWSYHGYGIQNFLQIEPRFASDPQRAREDPRIAEIELRALVDEAHARDIYVIFDVVLNHTGDLFEYEGCGSCATWAEQPYRIFWRDETGMPHKDWTEPPMDAHPDAVVSPIEFRRNQYFRRRGQGVEPLGDFASLKEFATDYCEFHPVYGTYFPVRDLLIRSYQYLLAKFDVDGFRIDTLKFIEPEFALAFGNAIREFAYSIGKKEFFTFGEVYDNEEKIAHYIGRNATETTDLVGVDAALDFPLFYKLPEVVKGSLPPFDIVNMFENRKRLQRGIISSQGEASKFFVTFIDNHDQHSRFYFSDSADPHRYDDQVAIALGCLFALQGIPCMYYGTEQGLYGSGNTLEAVREALWGKPNAFDKNSKFYKWAKKLAAIRNDFPSLKFGRQYFRPLSGDGFHFGISAYQGGVLAFSRILVDEEVITIANTSSQNRFDGEALIDFANNSVGSKYRILFSNNENAQPPGPVTEKSSGNVEISEIGGSINHGPTRCMRVSLAPMEIQILAKCE